MGANTEIFSETAGGLSSGSMAKRLIIFWWIMAKPSTVDPSSYVAMFVYQRVALSCCVAGAQCAAVFSVFGPSQPVSAESFVSLLVPVALPILPVAGAVGCFVEAFVRLGEVASSPKLTEPILFGCLS